MKNLLILFYILPLTGCYNPDPPLLKTALPNGYSFHSNGGIFGYIARPNGKRMSHNFGILKNGREQWCNGFGWSGNYVICELEIVDSKSNTGYTIKYFIMNTENEKITIRPTLEEARKSWSKITTIEIHSMLKKHKNTKEK